MSEKTKMSKEHRKRHRQLLKSLNEIWDDFVTQTNPTLKTMDAVSFFNVYMWLAKQTQGETENE